MTRTLDTKRRWWALYVLCLGDLMIVLDTTIVNVALPSIRLDLHFSEAALVWVVNAYMLTFGGFLLLGGRLGDLFGHRKLFLLGIVFFTAASLLCGLAYSQEMLVTARAIQGLGGAVVTAAGLSLMMDLFTDPVERTKAMGVFGFVGAGGGSVGVLLGGLLTSTLSWHWIFLVNIPIGVIVYLLSVRLIDDRHEPRTETSLDIGGAVTVTASLMLAVYAIVNGNAAGWMSTQTLGLLGAAAMLLAIFIAIESRVRAPLMPLKLFRLRNLAMSSVVAVLWAAAMFTWFFISALMMQLVLGYSAMQVALAFLPGNLIMAALSIRFSAQIVLRYGIRGPLGFGLGVAAIGLALFACTPENGSFVIYILPGMALLGLGGGIAFNPMLLAAMNDVEPSDSGLASGMVNTSFMMGGALGLAALASVAAARTDAVLAAGATQTFALNAGYHAAFLAGAICAGISAALGYWFVRAPKPSAQTSQPQHA